MRWLLDQLSGVVPPATDDQAAAAVMGDDPQGFLAWLRHELPEPELQRVEVDGAVLVAYLLTSHGRRYSLRVPVEDEAPHRIGWVTLNRVLPDGMEARHAVEADNDAILAVCRNTPVVLGEARITIDPGPDYFAYLRLMASHMPLVATDDGRPVAVHCAVMYPAHLEGSPVQMAQILHSRVLPQYAGLGLWSVMNRMVQGAAADIQRERYEQEDSSAGEPIIGCAYMAIGNDSVHRLGGAQGAWASRPYRVTIPAMRDGGTSGGAIRRATRGDAAEIVEILNRCHEGEELFRPYTVETLTARLERAPELYTWHDVLMGDGAVVGLWHAGLRRTRTEGGTSRASIRSLVLDYGCVPGHDTELERLLRAAAAEMQARRHDHLSIFTSDAARASHVVRSLGDGIEEYEFTTPSMPEPPTARERGVYVDQIYF